MGRTGLLPLLYSLLVFSKELQVGITDVVGTDDACLKEFFYKGIPPIYFNEDINIPLNQNDVFICQKRNGITYFVTRYSTYFKIPIYCAYQIKNFRKDPDRDKPFHWVIDKTLANQEKESHTRLQARDKDYINSTLDRGHLNPKYHNMYSLESMNATFTLTNAVPKIHIVNQKWFDFAEKPLYEKMETYCNSSDVRGYVITGVIPGQNHMRGVNIPEYVWSAAHCVDSKNRSVWSVGYLMSLNPLPEVSGEISISYLQSRLQNLLHGHNVTLFPNTPKKKKKKHKWPRNSCIAKRKKPKAGKVAVRV